MFQILNREYKQSIDSVEDEFPNSRYVMLLDNPLDDMGKLLAISTSIDTEVDKGMYVKSLTGMRYVLCGGSYGGNLGGLFKV